MQEPSSVPSLFRSLEPAFAGSVPPVGGAELSFGEAVGTFSGPRSWWGGPLDVEGLALGAVGAAAAALNLLTGVPGRFGTTAALVAGAFDSSGHLRINGHGIRGFAGLSGFRRTRDGWIRLHANYPHHEQRLMQALDTRTQDGVAAALRTMTSLEAEASILSCGGVAAAVRSRDEWLASGMGRSAAPGAWIEWTPAAGRPTGSGRRGLPDGDLRHPLQGVRVLDLTRVIAGPVATRLLGTLGADVLRIDPPQLPEIVDQFVETGFDKRSTVADLATAGDRHGLQQLLETADVVVTGYRCGALDRFGLEPQVLLASRPELAVVTLDAWGGVGPWSGQRGFDSIVQAATGIASRYGSESDDAGWQPGALPVQALDHATGYGLAAAAITLLVRRRQTGLGGAARMSLARTAEELFVLPAVPSTGHTGPVPEPCLGSKESTYGKLHYALPPLVVAGQPLDYAAPPVPYGSSVPAWV